MKNAWLLRPMQEGNNRMREFRAQGLISVGWPQVGNLTGKGKTELKEVLAGPPYELRSLALGAAYASLDIFVNRMGRGDLVLTPDGQDIFLGEILGDYTYHPERAKEGYPHQRKVRWLRRTAREELPMELRKSLRVQRIAADLSDHERVIRALATGEAPEAQGTVEVAYPLRPDFSIRFSLPRDMTQVESQRLSDFIKTLYF